MILDDLPSGGTVFVDANIFIYFVTAQSPACRRFVRRLEAREVEGVTGAHVLGEVLHRVMASEAVEKRLITPGNPARKLKEHPEIVRALVEYQRLVDRIPEMGVHVLPVDLEVIQRSRAVRLREGLLVHDSITVAMMEGAGLRAIATADRDFERVVGLEVYSP